MMISASRLDLNARRGPTRRSATLAACLALVGSACGDGDVEGESELRQPIGALMDAAPCAPGIDGGVDGGAAQPHDSGGSVPEPSLSTPSGLIIKSVTSVGPGCPAGSAKVTLAPDGGNFVVHFDKLRITSEQRTINCTLVLDVETKPGTVYALESYAASGRGVLVGSDRVAVTTRGVFTGDSAGGEATTDVNGPQSGTVALGAKTVAPRFSRCGRAQQAQVRLTLLGRALAKGSSFELQTLGPVRYTVRPCDGE